MTGGHSERGRPVLRALVVAWLGATGMFLGWRFAGVGRDMGPIRGRMPMDLHLNPLTLPVLALIAVTVGGLLLAARSPRTGATVALAGSAAYVVLGGHPWGVIPALAVLVVALLSREHARDVLPWLAAIPVIHLLEGWRQPALGLGSPATWFGLVSFLMWTAAPILVIQIARGRRESARRAQAEALRQAAADERLRVARDIHDVVGHSLSMISLQSGVALRVLDADPAQARTSLEAIRASSRDALAELRHTLGVFHAGADLAPTPSLAALPALVRDLERGAVAVTFTPVEARGIPATVQAAAYRVAQEGLTNAIRHAAGAPVTLHLARAERMLLVTVKDSGGPAAPVVEGVGLRGMRERVEALGGTLTVTSTTDGVTLAAELPWDEQ